LNTHLDFWVSIEEYICDAKVLLEFEMKRGREYITEKWGKQCYHDIKVHGACIYHTYKCRVQVFEEGYLWLSLEVHWSSLYCVVFS